MESVLDYLSFTQKELTKVIRQKEEIEELIQQRLQSHPINKVGSHLQHKCLPYLL